MKIAIIGSGRVGAALAAGWAKAGHTLSFGSRDPGAAKLQALLEEIGGDVVATGYAEAVADADVVVLAVPWSAAEATAQQLGALAGKIVIDCTNPLKPNFAGLEIQPGSDTDQHGSAAEQIAAWLPAAKVVKAFNTTGSANMRDPHYPSGPISMFLCGDDADAKASVARLARDLGFEPIDSGELTMARYLEPLALLWISLAFKQGLGPDFAITLVHRSGAAS